MTDKNSRLLKKTNARLVKELREKKSELKIESSLEKVRVIALAMMQRDDMLKICRAIATQLGLLDIKEIRNVQTAIFYTDRRTYMNYGYYAKHKKTVITETSYDNNKIQQAFAKKMLKGKGEFYVTHLKGKKVKEWLKYQKTTNVFIDRYLETASSLDYYWYSIGPVALGISTYGPLNKVEQKVFHRFLNVFELAYRRYIDIENAESNAKEAQIQASLEKVRAVAMSMAKADDLQDVCETIYKEFLSLGFSELRNAMINIHNNGEKSFINYDYSDTIGKSTNHLTYDIHPLIQKQIEKIRSADDAFSETCFTGKDLAEWKEFRREIGEKNDPRLEKAKGLYYYFYSTGIGSIGISTFGPIGEQKIILLRRFRNVFALSYQRYTDIKKAEAQTHEAQIQTSLERMRAVAMAMHKSDELATVAECLYKELIALGFDNIRNAQIAIEIDERQSYILYVYSDLEKISGVEADYNSSPLAQIVHKLLGNSKEGYYEKEYSGDEMTEWRRWRSDVAPFRDPRELTATSLCWNLYAIGKGHIGISTFDSITKEQTEIVKRFKNVFELSYSRFSDLQKAEIQTRDAQVELSLERVRAKTMAMHNSDDVADTVETMFNEVKKLGIETLRCGIGIMHEPGNMEVWTARSNENGKATIVIGRLDMYIHPLLEGAYLSWRDKIETYCYELKEQDLLNYFTAINNYPGYPIKYDISDLPKLIHHNEFHFAEGTLFVFSLNQLSEESKSIYKRFAGVFGQTYRRYLDLQKAEAQTKEAKIQLALERVRARTMAMFKSDELAETSAELFKQLIGLGMMPNRLFIGVIKNDVGDIDAWATLEDGQKLSEGRVLSSNKNVSIQKMFDGWRARKKFIIIDMHGKELEEYVQHLNDELHVPFTIGLTQQRRVQHIAYFSNGFIGMAAPEKQSAENIQLLLRFAEVFNLTYTRFLDLQKAESQAREARIEAALERVRGRTAAMQKSDDLKEVIQLISEQMVQLGIEMASAGFIINYKETNDLNIWRTVPFQQLADFVHIPYFDHPIFKLYIEAKEKELDFYPVILNKIDKDSLLTHLFAQVPNYPEEKKQFLYSLPAYADSHVLTKNVVLYIQNYTGIPYSDADNAILVRFGKSFDQTYTRFVDLQKAEAQAREAQIEIALERVRSRSMGMQKSEDLKEVIKIVYDQFTHLNIRVEHTGFVVDYVPKGDWHYWIADKNEIPSKITIPYFDSVWGNDFSKAKEKGNNFFATNLNFEEKNKFYQELLSFVTDLPEETRNFYFSCPGLAASTALSENVSLYIENFSGIPYSDEENKILIRFGKVFQQTYTRFLDLQKAELQAREAQIEAALERVRSKAMAMHNTNDLSDAASMVFTELRKLGINPIRCGVGILSKDNRKVALYASGATENGDYLALVGWALLEGPLAKQYDCWLKEEDYFPILKGDLLKEYYQALSKNFAVPLEQASNEQYGHFLMFASGFLFCWSAHPYMEAEIKILKRFTSVIDLTYKRYFDLQKAELLARESQIEAALEKVRGKAMAMRTSTDISTASTSVFTELKRLGIDPIRCGVGLMNKESRKSTIYSALSSNDGDSLTLIGSVTPSDNSVTENIYENWVAQTDYYPELDEEELMNYYAQLSPELSIPANSIKKDEKQYGHFISVSIGVIYAWSAYRYNEDEIKVLKRFASIIDLTFRRYMELQRSEATAKEAVKQAALDRIRADIASMRTVSDLDRITPLIWSELTVLGIPFVRCGVFIMDDEQEQIHTFLSTPDGKAIAAFHLPYDTPGNFSEIVNHWHQKKTYINHWDVKDFSGLADTLIGQGAVQTREQYLGSIPADGIHLHFLPFVQGMLYVGNITNLNGDEIDLTQSVADAFSTAYARYADFNKLEAAKQQVEKTLVELKQAQQQLVQAEKMASLGELTAGIAHEIQNPLNFVNNFSEVSSELIDELNAERKKPDNERNENLEYELLHDLKQNLQKINHHGMRADGIVKGMLQHSRSSSGQKEMTDINVLTDEYVRLAYHGFRAKEKSFNAKFETNYSNEIGKINIVPQDIGRALLNLINNAFFAVNEKQKTADAAYEPTITINTIKSENQILIFVGDNGNGIPKNIVDKIFQPFFTTKPTGSGTGLGLSLSYDIIKAHGGEIKVHTIEGKNTTFTILLPNTSPI